MTTAVSEKKGRKSIRFRLKGLRVVWQKEINVRDFIQQNYQPYIGDGSFLAPATERTNKIWLT